MSRARLPGFAFAALALSLCLLAGCPLPVIAPTRGSLTITIADRVSRTLLPAVSMQPASYSISGTGPNGASFTQSTSSGSLTLSALAFGTWTVTVNALNSDSTLIGQGFGTAEVHTGSTTTVAITVTPLSGSGTLSLGVSWPASQVQSPSIQASLLDQYGTRTPLPFTVSGSQASFSSAAIPAGYQTLTVLVLDNAAVVAGAVEVARIVAGQTTSGSYAFANVNQPGGSVQVNITPAMADPIPLSIGGVGATLNAESSMTATASTTDGTTGVTYVWYLNGASVGTGSSLTLGTGLAAGYYRLDVTGFTADGTRGGSASAQFTAIPGTGVPVPSVVTSISLPGTARSDGLEVWVPGDVEVSPDGSRVYVAVSDWSVGANNYFAVIDARTNSLAQRLDSPAFGDLDHRPAHICVTPDGSTVFVDTQSNPSSSGGSGLSTRITVVDAPTCLVRSVIDLGFSGENEGTPFVTPDGSFLLTSVSSSNSSQTAHVFVIDARAGQLRATIPIPGCVPMSPVYLVASPDSATVYIVSAAEGSGQVFHTSALNLQTLSTRDLGFAVAGSPWIGLGGGVVSPDGLRLFLWNAVTSIMPVIDTRTGATVREVQLVGTGTENVGMSPDGGHLVVMNNGYNFQSSSVIDTASFAFSTVSTPGLAARFFSPGSSVFVGARLGGSRYAFLPAGSYSEYLGNDVPYQLSVLDVVQGRIISTLPLGTARPTFRQVYDIAISSTGFAYVATLGTHCIWVINTGLR